MIESLKPRYQHFERNYMPVDPMIPRFDMKPSEVDEASRIVLECLQSALKQMQAKRLDGQTAVGGAVQMTMRLYSDMIGDEEEAIRQIRLFVDDWERDVLLASDETGYEGH